MPRITSRMIWPRRCSVCSVCLSSSFCAGRPAPRKNASSRPRARRGRRSRRPRGGCARTRRGLASGWGARRCRPRGGRRRRAAFDFGDGGFGFLGGSGVGVEPMRAAALTGGGAGRIGGGSALTAGSAALSLSVSPADLPRACRFAPFAACCFAALRTSS